MEYIRDKLTRPLEMLKNFDKTTSLVISQEEFVARLNVSSTSQLHRLRFNIIRTKGRKL